MKDDWSDLGNTQDESNSDNGSMIDMESSDDADWEAAESFEEYVNSEQQVREPQAPKVSKKGTAFIIFIACILIAMAFVLIDSIKIPKRQSSSGNQTAATTQAQSESPGGSTGSKTGSCTMVEIPSTTKLEYGTDVLTANGVVTKKLKYVVEHQIVYCVMVEVVFGTQSQTVNYFCNYSSFNSVALGDIVVLTYQQVNDSYISVSTISK